MTHVARDLDVRLDTLHRWLRAARAAANLATTDADVSTQEIARLKRDVAHLRMEQDMHKKVLGISSRMPH